MKTLLAQMGFGRVPTKMGKKRHRDPIFRLQLESIPLSQNFEMAFALKAFLHFFPGAGKKKK